MRTTHSFLSLAMRAIILALTLLVPMAMALSASDFQLTGWWSDMLVDDRAGLFDPKYLCKGSYEPITNGPTFDGTGKTCYMNPIAASYRNPTVLWFKDANGLDTRAPGFTVYAVAFMIDNSTEYWPTGCDERGVCSDCSNFDPVRKGYDTDNDETCDVLGSSKLCDYTSYYDGAWNVSDCALVAAVGEDSGAMMASWKQVSGFSAAAAGGLSRTAWVGFLSAWFALGTVLAL